MGDIKVFQIKDSKAVQLEGQSATLERSLQRLIEENLEVMLGVHFLASEYSTGKKHGGRIDTLGIDENGCPVIIEYKRTLNENVINQGLFYLDWLLDHRAEFQLRVMEKFGKEMSDNIEWGSPRLLCIAGGYTNYDVYAVQQINRNIELIRYSHYGKELILLEQVNVTTATADTDKHHSDSSDTSAGSTRSHKTAAESLEQADQEIRDLFGAFHDFALALGDDVQAKTLSLYFAYRRLKNFACIVVQNKVLKLWLKLDPDKIEMEDGFSRDVRDVGHWGTGDLEVHIKNLADLEKAKPLIVKSYEAN